MYTQSINAPAHILDINSGMLHFPNLREKAEDTYHTNVHDNQLFQHSAFANSTQCVCICPLFAI